MGLYFWEQSSFIIEQEPRWVSVINYCLAYKTAVKSNLLSSQWGCRVTVTFLAMKQAAYNILWKEMENSVGRMNVFGFNLLIFLDG